RTRPARLVVDVEARAVGPSARHVAVVCAVDDKERDAGRAVVVIVGRRDGDASAYVPAERFRGVDAGGAHDRFAAARMAHDADLCKVYVIMKQTGLRVVLRHDVEMREDGARTRLNAHTGGRVDAHGDEA